MASSTTGPIDSARSVPQARIGAEPLRSASAASRTALFALLSRDLTVLRKHLVEFVLRTIIQPFLLVFVSVILTSDGAFARASHARLDCQPE